MIPSEQAFSKLEDWTLQIAELTAVLHPNLKQWMWYDRLRDEWVFVGCTTGEAILLAIGPLAGIKKLPQPEDIGRWCVYKQGKSLKGPVHIDDIQLIPVFTGAQG